MARNVKNILLHTIFAPKEYEGIGQPIKSVFLINF